MYEWDYNYVIALHENGMTLNSGKYQLDSLWWAGVWAGNCLDKTGTTVMNRFDSLYFAKMLMIVLNITISHAEHDLTRGTGKYD